MRTTVLAALLAATPLAAASRHIAVAGLGGEPDYEKRFTALAQEARKYAHAEILAGPAASKDALLKALARVAEAATDEDDTSLLLIGHGTWDGAQYKFNLPGPDISAEELKTALDRIKGRQLVVLAATASGAAIPVLRREGRVVVTATRSGTEKNAVVFSRYWVEALRDAAADTDKNGTVSALEAFRYASRRTADYYSSQNRLATEHPLLEDTGKGEGVRQPGPESGAGLLAGRFPVVRLGPAQEALRDPAKQKLLALKEELEREIDKLKYEKAALPAAGYRKELAALLLELARVEEALEK
jgi:hypothetical protein